MALDKAALLAAIDRKVQLVPVPEWGGDVYVRSFSARDSLKIEAQIKELEDTSPGKIIPYQLAMFLCDEKGAQILTAEEADALLDRSPQSIKKVIEAGMALNGLGEDPKGN